MTRLATVLYVASVLRARPRAIDRYIDYFGDRADRRVGRRGGRPGTGSTFRGRLRAWAGRWDREACRER